MRALMPLMLNVADFHWLALLFGNCQLLSRKTRLQGKQIT